MFKRRGIIFLIFFSAVFMITAGVFLWPETYEARAKILVKIGRENISISSLAPSAQQQVVASLQVRPEDINSEIEILKNRFIIEKLVNKLGSKFLYPQEEEPETFFRKIKYKLKQGIPEVKDTLFRFLYFADLKKELSPVEKAELEIVDNLEVEQIRKSDVIEARFRWHNPEIAQVVLKELINFFMERHLEVHKVSEDYSFLKEQVDITGARLKDLENQLERLKSDEGIISYLDQQKLLLENKAKMESDLKWAQTELAETARVVHEFKKQLSYESEVVKLKSQVKRNPILEPLKIKLLELELEKRKLATKYLKNSRPIRAVDNELKKVRNRLEKENANVTGIVTTGLNTVYEETKKGLMQAEVRLAALREKKKALQRHLNWYQRELRKLSGYDIELRRFDRLIQIENGSHKLYRKRLEEARVTNLLDSKRIMNVKLIEPPRAALIPVQPRKLPIIGIGMLLSLFSGIGIAFLFEYLDHAIYTAEDVDRLIGVPVLASFPEGEKWKL